VREHAAQDFCDTKCSPGDYPSPFVADCMQIVALRLLERTLLVWAEAIIRGAEEEGLGLDCGVSW
jgi:hypothetical protein